MRNTWIAAVVCAALLPAQPPSGFERDVKPVLERSCYSCHGPKLQMANLRLDSRESARRTFQPGDSAASSLYTRIAGLGGLARMPMGQSPLPAAEIAAIRKWIEDGAHWPDSASSPAAPAGPQHWAYVPPVRPALPRVSNEKWIRNPVDRFILARLDREGLQPSPEADRVTLLRRLSLDLIGLPPTAAEVDAFLADNSPDAYSRQVERLLRSPHYGERWARLWLDAARYADSDGFEKDKQRWVWFYRDWVVNAFNRDLPYDRFIIQQIAGDLLPGAGQEERVATGFLRNSMINEEGGVDPEQFRMEAMFDRMDAIGKSILGLTIQCAQCHNHKYDALTQEDYYRTFAFLNNSYEGSISAYTPEQEQKRAEIFRRIREIESGLQHANPDWPERMARWETQMQAQPAWTVLHPEPGELSTGGQKHYPLEDGSILAAGYAPTKHVTEFAFKTTLTGIRAVRLEQLPDPNLPQGGPGRSIFGASALTEFEVNVRPLDNPQSKGEKIRFVSATADVNPKETELAPTFYDKTDRRRVTGPVAFAIDGKDDTAWSIDAGPGRRNQARKAVFVAAKPFGFEGGSLLTVYLSQKHGGWNSDDNMNNNLGRFRISVTTAADASADPLPARVREILAIPAGKRSPAQVQAVFSVFRESVPEWKGANEEIEALWNSHPEPVSQLVLNEMPAPRSTHVLTRGDFLKPGRAVTPGVPSFLHPMPEGAPASRLGFAMWLADRKSPTTARSFVNRVWQTYFGTGIVSTSEDLGRQAEPPSHPELLDWLAVEFMDNGWSVKKLHRTIVMSATYRQSSRVTPRLAEKDPFNRLLARGPRFRVEAEIVRDITLAAAGLLNTKVGGPPVYPPAPEFLFLPPASYGPKQWHEEKGPDRYRRGLYTFRYRSVPYPMLQAFDAPNGDFSCVRRTRSNTPLQALTSLNEPLFLEAAQGLARLTLAEGGATDAQRLTYAFRRCVSREPAEAETAELLGLLKRQGERIAEGWVNPWLLAGYDPARPPRLAGGVTPSQLAAWTAVSRVLLNLDETITKE